MFPLTETGYNRHMKLTPPHKDLLRHVLLFLFLFIVVSGITGSWIVRSPLLYGAGFWIYGNMGKMVLLMTLFFPFLIRDRIAKIPAVTKNPQRILWFLAAAGVMPVFFITARFLKLRLPDLPPVLLVLSHVLLLVQPLFVLIGVFGIPFLRSFAREYKRDIAICLGLAAFTYLGIFQVWKLWPIFSHGVLTAVSFLFSLTFPTRVVPPTTLIVNSFGVRIEQACSGLDSLFMFSALYLFIGLADWKKINKGMWLLLYLPATLGLYIVNIFRVYLIVLIGAVYSPKLALELFHTYAGMVLFIIYFLLFLKFFYPKISKKSE